MRLKKNIGMLQSVRENFIPSHGAKSTITATPNSAPLFQNSILRDQQIGRQISIHALRLPEGAVPPDAGMSATSFTDASILQEPLRLFLLDRRPDFTGSGIFSRCVRGDDPFAREKSALVERFRKAEETSIGSLTSVSGVLNSENEGTLEFSGAETMGVDDGSVSMVKKFLERCEMRRS
jgi:hypothetical protein